MTTSSEPQNQFVEECRAAGISVEAYHGRWYWFGPAARASDNAEFVEVARATSVELQWDSPLAYPVQPDQAWYDWAKDNLPPECDICGEPAHDERDHDDD